jgi:phosphoribosylglycinamide formyltransferase-1
LGATYSAAKEIHEQTIHRQLEEYSFDYICLAGYMRIFSKDFIAQNWNSSLGLSTIINIHPSLLPSFKGKDPYEQAFAYGVTLHGVSVHFVEPDIDAGPIILQKSYKRLKNDNFEDFKKRGLDLEYIAYREALKRVAAGELQVVSPEHRFLTWSEV